MHITSLVSALAVGSSLVAASPIEKRDVAQDFKPPPGGDVTILNYALTLEYLERKFYQEGIKNYTQQNFVDAGFPDPFYKNLKEVVVDEEVIQPTCQTHIYPLNYELIYSIIDSRLLPRNRSWGRRRQRSNLCLPLHRRRIFRRLSIRSRRRRSQCLPRSRRCHRQPRLPHRRRVNPHHRGASLIVHPRCSRRIPIPKTIRHPT